MHLIIFMMVIKSVPRQTHSLAIFSHTKQHMRSLLIHTPTLSQSLWREQRKTFYSKTLYFDEQANSPQSQHHLQCFNLIVGH